MIGSFTSLPPEKIVRYSLPRFPFIDKFFSLFLKKYGFTQLGSFFRVLKRQPELVYPYMNKSSQEKTYRHDFHSHTHYSDGKGDFKHNLYQMVRKKHLDGIAFTDHPWHLDENENRILDDKVIHRSYDAVKRVEMLKKNGKLPEHFITFPGSCEFFVQSDIYSEKTIEMIALGLPRDFIEDNGGLTKIIAMKPDEFVERVHDCNGITILPHPFYFTSAHLLLKRKDLTRNSTPDAFEGINYTIGFLFDKNYEPLFEKVRNLSDELKLLSKFFGYGNWMSRLISERNNLGKSFDYPVAQKIASVGSSDAHFSEMIGGGCTIFKQPIETFEDLRLAIKKRKSIPTLNHKWSENSQQIDVYGEILDKYRPKLNKMIQIEDVGFLNKIKLAKIVLSLLSILLESKIF